MDEFIAYGMCNGILWGILKSEFNINVHKYTIRDEGKYSFVEMENF